MKNKTEQAKTTIETAEEAAWTIENLKNFLYVSIISADNDKYTEEVKQEVIRRREESGDTVNWRYVFEPLGKDAEKYSKIMEAV